jgi:DNA polymerase-4
VRQTAALESGVERDAGSGGGQTQRLVAHLDVDAFYVSVECGRRPQLRGKPVVVAGSGPRAVVTTASYEARRHGVGSAMPASRARQLCPQAVFVEPDFATYRERSRELMAIVRAFAERVEVVGLDEAYLDISALAFPHAAMRRLVGRIKQATGLTCSVGIGPNKLVAKVASDAEKPAGFVVLTREQACERFASAPPGILPGIGPKTASRLSALGLSTIGALAAAPEQLLASRFGANLGLALARRASFRHDGDVAPVRKAVSESRERTFDRDVTDHSELQRILERMAGDLCASLARHGRRGRTIAIKVRLDNFSTVTRARTLAEATCDPALVAPVAVELLRKYAPPRPVRLLGVRVAGFDQASEAQEPEEPRPRSAEGETQLALPLGRPQRARTVGLSQ